MNVGGLVEHLNSQISKIVWALDPGPMASAKKIDLGRTEELEPNGTGPEQWADPVYDPKYKQNTIGGLGVRFPTSQKGTEGNGLMGRHTLVGRRSVRRRTAKGGGTAALALSPPLRKNAGEGERERQQPDVFFASTSNRASQHRKANQKAYQKKEGPAWPSARERPAYSVSYHSILYFGHLPFNTFSNPLFHKYLLP